MPRVICPFCLKVHDFSKSLACSEKSDRIVPASYVKDYRRIRPLWLATVGFTGHGKTTYLDSLMLTLEEASGLWSGYCSSDDQFTLDALQHGRAENRATDLPKGSQPGMPRPLLLNVHRLPIYGSRSLVMYDMAGETFDHIEDVMTFATVLKHVQAVWFMVSLPDLEDDVEGKTIQDLLSVYLSAMERLRVNLKGRTLIVVYTKADKADIPAEVVNYVQSDPLRGEGSPEIGVPKEWNERTLQDYMNRMEEISGRLERFTRERIPGGRSFVSRAQDQGLHLVFSAVSALGVEPPKESTKLGTEKQRLRVLDPLLWAIRLPTDDQVPNRLVDLIVDGSTMTFAAPEVQSLWDYLTDQSDELSSRYLGQTWAVSSFGQRPPAAGPAITRSRLIGPILENAPHNAFFVALAANPIVDLVDFANTSWRNRLLLVCLDSNYQPDWPHTVPYLPGDDPNLILEKLLVLLNESEKTL